MTALREYRVVFTHVRHRTKFEVTVRAVDLTLAVKGAREVLKGQLEATAGELEEWTNTETVEVEP